MGEHTGRDGRRGDQRGAGARETTPRAPVWDETLIAQLVGDAQASGLGIDGENGLLARLTKLVLESALEGEITAHLGCVKHEMGASADGTPVTAPARRRCWPRG